MDRLREYDRYLNALRSIELHQLINIFLQLIVGLLRGVIVGIHGGVHGRREGFSIFSLMDSKGEGTGAAAAMRRKRPIARRPGYIDSSVGVIPDRNFPPILSLCNGFWRKQLTGLS